MAIAAAESQFHVLAVDDSLIDRTLIARLLKTSSYQVTTVDSGSKALEFLGFHEDDQSNPNKLSILPNNNQDAGVNLIITDYCMPGMTGYDLLKKVKHFVEECRRKSFENIMPHESSSLRNIPVVIISSENVPSRITRCLDGGAEEFFLKPVQLSDLNRLRPYMMKTKLKIQNQDKRDDRPEVETTEIQPQQQQPPQSQPKPPPPAQQQQQPPLPPSQPASNNNKRKVLEEGISTDRTRRRYNDITTMV